MRPSTSANAGAVIPSEARVKRGERSVTISMGEKEFHETLGRDDPCP